MRLTRAVSSPSAAASVPAGAQALSEVPNRSSAMASSLASRPRTRSARSSAIISTSSATVR
jgi:hypothetical protein